MHVVAEAQVDRQWVDSAQLGHRAQVRGVVNGRRALGVNVVDV
jgi:hypothetical protein